MLMYTWDAYPPFPARVSGVSSSRERAHAAAASALLGDRSLLAAKVTEVEASLAVLSRAYRPTGTTWTALRAGGGVAWAKAIAPARELAS